MLAALRNDPAIAATPFILITGETKQTPLRHGMRLGADDYLAKPFALSDLVEAVESRLRKHEQTRAQADAKVAELRTNLSLTLPHELLSPLTCVLGYSELILTDFDRLQPGQILEMTAEIQKCGHRLLRLTQNYLYYAGLELNRLDPQRAREFRAGRTADTAGVIAQSARSMAAKYARSGNLVFELSGGAAMISAEYLSKIVEELTDNACKFSPLGSLVHISTVTSARGFQLNLTDQGYGIKPQQIVQIGAYQQFDRQLNEQQGVGLGLAIVKKLAEMHDGTLEFQSGSPTGTTVQIDLPAVSGSRPGGTGAPSPPRRVT